MRCACQPSAGAAGRGRADAGAAGRTEKGAPDNLDGQGQRAELIRAPAVDAHSPCCQPPQPSCTLSCLGVRSLHAMRLHHPATPSLQVYSGGLGSYTLLVMVASFLQLHPSRQPPGEGQGCGEGLPSSDRCAAMSMHPACKVHG